jgi:hypothetical protein
MFARSYAPVAPADFVLGRPAVGKVVEDFDRYDHVTDRQLRESGPNRLDLLFGERAAPRRHLTFAVKHRIDESCVVLGPQHGT